MTLSEIYDVTCNPRIHSSVSAGNEVKFTSSTLHSQKHVIAASLLHAGLLPCCHQVNIRMRSHRLLRGLMTSLLQVINSLAAS